MASGIGEGLGIPASKPRLRWRMQLRLVDAKLEKVLEDLNKVRQPRSISEYREALRYLYSAKANLNTLETQLTMEYHYELLGGKK